MDSIAPSLLIALLAAPIIGAVLAAYFGRTSAATARSIALAAVLVSLVITFLVMVTAERDLIERGKSDPATTFRPLYQTRVDLLSLGSPTGSQPAAAIQFYLGIDGLNLWLIVLTSVLMLPSVLISWNAIKDRANEFYAWLLILQVAMTGVFLAFDVILFYVFFELTLVPLYFLIGIWGGPMRREASRKFFLYTLAGSLITLLGTIGVVIVCYHNTKTGSGGSRLTFAIPELVTQVQDLLKNSNSYSLATQEWVFLALAVGFAIKVPLFPMHTWLPLAHVEAPTAGSVLLAGVLLKLGTYGFLRLALPLAPNAAITIGVPLLGTLAAIGIVYGALCAFAQSDVKKLVAYSSVSHLGFCVLGLIALNAEGLTGALLQMVNHGLSTGGLFLLVGMLYERYHTRMIPDYSGMAARLKLLSAFMVFICLTSVGMPGLNGFVGEMLVLAGIFKLQGAVSLVPVFAIVMAIGIVLGAWYLFTMLKAVFFGPLKEPHHDGHAVADLNSREIAIMLPIMALCVLLGVRPQPVIDTAKGDIEVVSRILDDVRNRPAADER